MKFELEKDQQWEVLASSANYRPGELASRCDVSLRTLQRHFRKHYGQTVSEWLRAVRLDEAYRRLIEGNTVKHVAASLGYKQLSHFSRDFKGYFGVAPRFLSSRRPKILPPNSMPLERPAIAEAAPNSENPLENSPVVSG